MNEYDLVKAENAQLQERIDSMIEFCVDAQRRYDKVVDAVREALELLPYDYCTMDGIDLVRAALPEAEVKDGVEVE